MLAVASEKTFHVYLFRKKEMNFADLPNKPVKSAKVNPREN